MRYTNEQIARVIHVANAELQYIQGDTAPSQPWDSESEDIRQNAIANVAAARDGVTTWTLHEMWCDDKRKHGWTYGPEKDAAKKTHPCLVPYDELPDYQKDKSRVFVGLVRILTHDMMLRHPPFLAVAPLTSALVGAESFMYADPMTADAPNVSYPP